MDAKDDLFNREQQILDRANSHLEAVRDEISCNKEEFILLIKGYESILRQLRRITKISDKTAVTLNTSKLLLLDKINIDALTGIYNRHFLEERLKEEIETQSRTKGSKLSLLMLDVDFFKKYNDNYGHGMGDTCLKAVAVSIKNSLSRKSDFVARYGGEEFVAVFPSTGKIGACAMAEKILHDIRACAIPHEKSDVSFYVTVSIGVTTATVRYTHQASDYIKCADEAMYISKESGRNQYTFIPFEEGRQ